MSEEHYCDWRGSPADGDVYDCIKGEIFGPCEVPTCGGVCEAIARCACDCHQVVSP